MAAIVHIALGSNRRHGAFGSPKAVVAAAIAALGEIELTVVARSAIQATSPLGPRQRHFANAVVAVTTSLSPDAMLDELQAIERAFGRRPGRRWGPRVLDLDIIAAGQTVTLQWRTARSGLVVPHRDLAYRRFVLDPLVKLAGGWRHPVLHLTARQLHARLRRPKRSTAVDP